MWMSCLVQLNRWLNGSFVYIATDRNGWLCRSLRPRRKRPVTSVRAGQLTLVFTRTSACPVAICQETKEEVKSVGLGRKCCTKNQTFFFFILSLLLFKNIKNSQIEDDQSLGAMAFFCPSPLSSEGEPNQVT